MITARRYLSVFASFDHSKEIEKSREVALKTTNKKKYLSHINSSVATRAVTPSRNPMPSFSKTTL